MTEVLHASVENVQTMNAELAAANAQENSDAGSSPKDLESPATQGSAPTLNRRMQLEALRTTGGPYSSRRSLGMEKVSANGAMPQNFDLGESGKQMLELDNKQAIAAARLYKFGMALARENVPGFDTKPMDEQIAIVKKVIVAIGEVKNGYEIEQTKIEKENFKQAVFLAASKLAEGEARGWRSSGEATKALVKFIEDFGRVDLLQTMSELNSADADRALKIIDGLNLLDARVNNPAYLLTPRVQEKPTRSLSEGYKDLMTYHGEGIKSMAVAAIDGTLNFVFGKEDELSENGSRNGGVLNLSKGFISSIFSDLGSSTDAVVNKILGFKYAGLFAGIAAGLMTGIAADAFIDKAASSDVLAQQRDNVYLAVILFFSLSGATLGGLSGKAIENIPTLLKNRRTVTSVASSIPDQTRTSKPPVTLENAPTPKTPDEAPKPASEVAEPTK